MAYFILLPTLNSRAVLDECGRALLCDQSDYFTVQSNGYESITTQKS